ncbi:MAG: hypothetical protein HZA91_19080 [Verrucomicrobia bacterium]|nr:hypothetical protein [Verrucomicrobiota bacterium]
MKTAKVYKVRYSEGFEWLLPANQADVERLRFTGQPRADSWQPVKMKRLKVTEQGCALEPSDFPACSGGDMLIISRAASDKIGRYLEQYGELLPLICDEGDFWILNVTRLVDALDERKSRLLRASDNNAVLMIQEHVFCASKLGYADVFKLSQMVRGLIYVTDAFVELISRSKLKGVAFVQVWPPNQNESTSNSSMGVG